jgi:xylulokinase
MDVLIGLDQGTSSTKGVVLGSDGSILHRVTMKTPLENPHPGYFEYSIRTYIQIQLQVLQDLIHQLPPYACIKGLSIASASGNTVLCDKQIQPLHSVISWMDQRFKQDRIDEEMPLPLDAQAIQDVAGWIWVGGFTLAHIAWIKATHPEWYHKVRFVHMNSDYFVRYLTGSFVVDYSTATPSYLLDQKKQAWNEILLDYLSINTTMLPRLVPTAECIGKTQPNVLKELEWEKPFYVISGSFDHPAAAVAMGCTQPGELLLSCGTSWVGFYPHQDRELGIAENLLVDPFLTDDHTWGILFSIAGIGERIQTFVKQTEEWYRKKGQTIQDYFSTLAETSPPGANGLILDVTNIQPSEAFIVEISSVYSLNDLYRALMEGVVFEARYRMDQLSRVGLDAHKISMVGGPAESKLWSQIVADVFNKPLGLLHGQYAGAVGAAIYVGKGLDLFPHLHVSRDLFHSQYNIIEPLVEMAAFYEGIYQHYVTRKTK